MTNISVNYDDAALWPAGSPGTYGLTDNAVFMQNVRQAMETGEPGFSFNFGDKENETLRNACTEVTSEDDSDVCNLGSINVGNIRNSRSFVKWYPLLAKFLVCGTLRADLPMIRFIRFGKRTDDWASGLWASMNGYSSADKNTR
jgi:ribonucleoside-diphosphate reductase alpha chain